MFYILFSVTCREQKDPAYCPLSYTKDQCIRLSNVAFDCPFLCNVCPCKFSCMFSSIQNIKTEYMYYLSTGLMNLWYGGYSVDSEIVKSFNHREFIIYSFKGSFREIRAISILPLSIKIVSLEMDFWFVCNSFMIIIL